MRSAHVRGGLRIVEPYFFCYRSTAKERWLGKTLLEVFKNDFLGTDDVCQAIKDKRISVESSPENPTAIYKLQRGDVVLHFVHRHEAPVSNEQVRVIHDSDDLLVVNKPSNLPVHPCANYRYNSLFYQMQEARQESLHIAHRLDKLTSGLVLLAKTAAKAKEIQQQIEERRVTKLYLARVKGRVRVLAGKVCIGTTEAFPPAHNSSLSLNWQGDCEGDWMTISCGIRKVQDERSKKRQRHAEGEGGGEDEDQSTTFTGRSQECCDVWAPGARSATTVMRLVRYNAKDDTSLLLCKPVTGRTHQIRLHCEWIGHPIANDQTYNQVLKSKIVPSQQKQREDDEDNKEQEQLQQEFEEARRKREIQRQRTERRKLKTQKKRIEQQKQIERRRAQAAEQKHHPPGSAADTAPPKPEPPSPPAAAKCLEGVSGLPSSSSSASERAAASADAAMQAAVLRHCPICGPNARTKARTKEDGGIWPGIWLHAWRYVGPGWDYTAPLPEWACEVALVNR